MEDASLEDFVDAGTDDVGASSMGSESARGLSTYAFAPEGAACAACGAVVRRRWRQGRELVCPDCKRWGE